MLKYILDTNVFIQAKNIYYRYEFCEGFWRWLAEAHQEELVFSLKKGS